MAVDLYSAALASVAALAMGVMGVETGISSSISEVAAGLVADRTSLPEMASGSQ